MYFKNKICWITGASSGIGAALALQLAKQQAVLILTARNMEALEKVQRQCLEFTSSCKVIAADLSIEASNELAVQKAMAAFGKIDVVVLNAGVTQRSLATETSIAVFRQLLEINFFSHVVIAKTLFPYFQQQASSQIVVISSMAGLMGFPQRSGYSAAKHALHGFFETLQTEQNIKGLDITIVSPGRINTPISLSALTKDGSAYNKLDEGQLKGIAVNTCAAKILKAVAKKRKHITIARGERLLWWIKWYLPPLYFRIAHKKGKMQ